MRDQLQVQEPIEIRMDSLSKESCKLWSQSQADGAWINQLSSQVQELIEALGTREAIVGRDLEELK